MTHCSQLPAGHAQQDAAFLLHTATSGSHGARGQARLASRTVRGSNVLRLVGHISPEVQVCSAWRVGAGTAARKRNAHNPRTECRTACTAGSGTRGCTLCEGPAAAGGAAAATAGAATGAGAAEGAATAVALAGRGAGGGMSAPRGLFAALPTSPASPRFWPITATHQEPLICCHGDAVAPRMMHTFMDSLHACPNTARCASARHLHSLSAPPPCTATLVGVERSHWSHHEDHMSNANLSAEATQQKQCSRTA